MQVRLVRAEWSIADKPTSWLRYRLICALQLILHRIRRSKKIERSRLQHRRFKTKSKLGLRDFARYNDLTTTSSLSGVYDVYMHSESVAFR